MKSKLIFFIGSIILLVSILSVAYYKTNYKTINEAINESNVPIDEILYTTDYKGHVMIFYSEDEILSVGLIEKVPLGYRWGFGSGSKQFNEENQILTRMFSNLQPKNMRSEEDLVSLSFGVIYENSIEKIMIKYEDQKITDATIIETKKGRIWYCFSNKPINYDPEVTRFYNDGTIKSGWY